MSVGTKCPIISDLHIIRGSPVAIGAPKQVVVVEFWATWCPPCRASIPHLSALQSKYGSKEVHIVGVSTEKDVSRLEQFVKQMGSSMDYTVAADLNGTAEQALYLQSSATGIPHAFVIGTDSTILWAGHPMDPGFEASLARAAEQAPERRPAGPPPRALGPISASEEELAALPVKQLKSMLAERGVAHADCVEKGDLVRRIRERCSNVTYYA